jgi:capsule polysaccharide modification protein KpsS
MGWFFSHLAGLLATQGHTVTKVHFNGGDQLFWQHPGALRFNADHAQLDVWLRALIAEREIDALVIFGQMRPIHVVAREVARSMGVEIFVFEEGYLRPSYVTIERRGVNARSLLPRVASFYRDTDLPQVPVPQPTGQSMWRMVAIAAAYGAAYWLLRPLYGQQTYHRCISPLTETWCWARGAARHLWYRWRERGALAALTKPQLHKRWFLVPLQVHNDSQVINHSRYASVQEFIEEVVASFAAHAPADARLVIKHHPMDRAYTDYTGLVAALRRFHQLGERLMYVHDQHLPTMLQHAAGVVTINSTVGLQSLHHGTPVKTLAESVYQIPGLVYDGELSAFWKAPGLVDAALIARFRSHLAMSTQLNASFYARMPALRVSQPAATSHGAQPVSALARRETGTEDPAHELLSAAARSA